MKCEAKAVASSRMLTTGLSVGRQMKGAISADSRAAIAKAETGAEHDRRTAVHLGKLLERSPQRQISERGHPCRRQKDDGRRMHART